jgi:mRNA-degrading endonuclease toxin of MazEF toxin-antitoxin module
LFTRLLWIRTLDKSRRVKLIGELGLADMEAGEKALKIHLSLPN